LPGAVRHDEGRPDVFDGPRRREAAFRHAVVNLPSNGEIRLILELAMLAAIRRALVAEKHDVDQRRGVVMNDINVTKALRQGALIQ
jgi:hypothetical protein